MSSNEPLPVTGGSSSTRLLAGVVLLLTFLGGMVIGIVGDRVLMMMRPRMAPRGPSFIVERLDRHLNLNAQQRVAVTEIVGRHQARIASIWSGVRPQVRSEIEAANAEIAQVLTPEQRQKFDSMKLRFPPPHRGPGGRMYRGGE